MISTRQITYFLAVAETQQISAAARALNVSQSTITISIKELEAHLGVELFERLPRHLRLTNAGHRFKSHAHIISTELNAALRNVKSEAHCVTGNVRLGMSWTLSSYFAFPVIERFARKYPDIILDVSEDFREELERKIIDDELDLALVLTSNLSGKTNIENKTFHVSARRLWVASNHPFADYKQVSLADVASEPYAVLRSDEAEKQALSYWKNPITSPKVKFASSSIEAVRNFVGIGGAVTILSDVVYRPWTLDGRRIERIDIAEPIPKMDVGVIWRSNKRLSKASELLRDAFCQTS